MRWEDFVETKWSRRASSALAEALAIARRTGSGRVSILHLLCGILRESGSVGSSLLKLHGIGETDVLGGMEPPQRREANGRVAFDAETKRVMERALFTAAEFRHSYLGTEHLLWAVAKHRKDVLPKPVFAAFESAWKTIEERTAELLESLTRFPNIQALARFVEDGSWLRMLPPPPGARLAPAERSGPPVSRETPREEPRREKPESQLKPEGKSSLPYFTEDLTARARRGELDPLVGREREVNRLIHILSRRLKNNPVLIGEPGVGKTAIVQGLASRIASGEVPEALAKKRLLALDMPLIVAGTVFRGEFEARLKEILREATAEGALLFLDELHTVVGAGSAQGSLDAANMLKPALSRGEIQVIGATTFEEYRRYIEKDAALERRFQPVMVHEERPEETIRVLAGLAPLYEKHHRLEIHPETLRAAVFLSERYLPERYLPDKAIDLLDEACSRLSSYQKNDAKRTKITRLTQRLEELRNEKELAIRAEAYERALLAKTEEEKLSAQLVGLQVRPDSRARERPLLEPRHIAEVLSEMTGIPIGEMPHSAAKQFAELEATLSSSILGQGEAIAAVSKALRRSVSGLGPETRPIGSFLFLGPTGVGKTELAKVLARVLVPERDALVKLDMSEYMEPHSVSRLLGAPPGYIGYEEGGELLDRVRRNPYSVILFDEIEKAHPQVAHILLQILEEGTLSDAQGRNVDFRNTVIILTSNLGTNEFAASGSLRFAEPAETQKQEKAYEEIKARALEELKRRMRPELLNRLDAIVVFRPLGPETIRDIVTLELRRVKTAVEERGIRLGIGRGVRRFLATLAYEPPEGARKVRRVIQREVEDRIAEKLIRQRKPPARITLTVQNGFLRVG